MFYELTHNGVTLDYEITLSPDGQSGEMRLTPESESELEQVGGDEVFFEFDTYFQEAACEHAGLFGLDVDLETDYFEASFVPFEAE